MPVCVCVFMCMHVSLYVCVCLYVSMMLYMYWCDRYTGAVTPKNRHYPTDHQLTTKVSHRDIIDHV